MVKWQRKTFSFLSLIFLKVSPRETKSWYPGDFGHINTSESSPTRAWPLPWVRLAWLPWSKLWTSPHLQSCVALIRLLLGMISAFCYLLSTVWESSSTSRQKKIERKFCQQKTEFPCPVWCPGIFNLLECCTSHFHVFTLGLSHPLKRTQFILNVHQISVLSGTSNLSKAHPEF